MSQVKVDFVRAYGKNCLGCVNHNRDIMITYMNGEEFVDVFMNTTDAKQFSNELIKRLKQNEEDTDEIDR